MCTKIVKKNRKIIVNCKKNCKRKSCKIMTSFLFSSGNSFLDDVENDGFFILGCI